jgi:hypothetical protein
VLPPWCCGIAIFVRARVMAITNRGMIVTEPFNDHAARAIAIVRQV